MDFFDNILSTDKRILRQFLLFTLIFFGFLWISNMQNKTFLQNEPENIKIIPYNNIDARIQVVMDNKFGSLSMEGRKNNHRQLKKIKAMVR